MKPLLASFIVALGLIQTSAFAADLNIHDQFERQHRLARHRTRSRWCRRRQLVVLCDGRRGIH